MFYASCEYLTSPNYCVKLSISVIIIIIKLPKNAIQYFNKLRLGDKLKAKLEQFANGTFEYENPQILLSEEEIILTLDSGNSCVGEFTIKNTKNTVIKGFIYTSNDLIKLSADQFNGINNVISYELMGVNFKETDSIKCEIYIISDCGETRLPIYITVESPSIPSSMGKIKDLFNFANLAKVNWSEAVRLFKTKEFRELVRYQDEKYLLQYDNLVKSRSSSQGLEEFLIAIRKKLQINFVIDKNVLHYEVGTDSFMDKVTLMKDNWGYEEIKATTDAPFLTLEHKIIWSDYFIGNTYPLEFVINPALMGRGNHFGRIFLTSVHETIIVEVTCHKKKDDSIKSSRKEIKEKILEFTKLYIKFRKNELEMNEYVDITNELLQSLIEIDRGNRLRYLFMQNHLQIISDSGVNITDQLYDLRKEVDKLKEDKDFYESAFLYLKALISKNDATIHEALTTIRAFYLQSNENWMLLWFLLYLDKKYDNHKNQKLGEIKEAYNNGCTSPILYYEAMTIINEEPVLLHELGGFELQVLYWSIKNDYCKEEAAHQFTYLVGKKKSLHRLYIECLTTLYNKFYGKDILSTICSLLIKGHNRSNKYFHWFKLGVKEQLRITELYEYYMYSLDEELGQELPQSVLLYFIYNSNLSDKKKAYLYGYIIRNKGDIPSLYHNYYKRIEQLAHKFLKDHVINRDLAVIYTDVLNQSGLPIEIAKELPEVMFKCEIGCNNKNIKGVYTVYKELVGERYYPFVNQVAYVDIFTQDYELIFVDNFDNRYTKTIEYTLDKLMDSDNYAKEYVKFNKHPMLLLHLAGKALTYQKFDEESVTVRKQLLSIKNLNEEYRNQIHMDLIEYYYDNFKSEEMENYLDLVNLNLLKKPDRIKMIELYLVRDHYEKGIKAIQEFGYEDIQINKLLKLSSYLLHIKNDELSNQLLVEIAYHIFSMGKYNEEILKFLENNYKGSTISMYRIWEACTNFEMDTVCIEENVLLQMLFTEDYIVNSVGIFLNYYKYGTNQKLIRAYLSYHAYKYLVDGRMIRSELFEIMKKELVYEENDICMLALLKKLSSEECYSEGEIELIDINVHRFLKNGIILPFFKRFCDVIKIHPQISDKFFIEYITSPSHKVTIHYQMEDENEDFIAEIMPKVLLGIHIKEFVLFYNESIRYYIAEESDDGQITITESVNISLGQDMKLEEDTWYNQINFLLTALEMKDDTTLLEGLDNLVTTKELANDLFKTITL